MKKRILLIILLFPLAFVSCVDEVKLELNQPITRYDKFKNTASLLGETIEFEEFSPCFVFIVDTFVVLSTPTLISPPHIAPFYVYSKNNLREPLGKLGSKGRGPWEFINASSIRQSYIDSIGDTHLWLENYDVFFADFNLSQSLKESKAIVCGNVEYDDFLIRTSKHLIVNDSIILSKCEAQENGLRPIYYFYNIKNQQIVDSIDIYSYNESVNQEKGLLATGQNIKPDRSKVVFTMIHFNAIHIADLKTGEIKSFSVREEKEMTNQAILSGDYNYCYDGITVTDDYIFAIFRGVPKSLFKLVPNFKLQVFDWNGRPLHEIELDSRARYISVDPKTNTLYGVDPDEGTLHKYELDAVLKNTHAAN